MTEIDTKNENPQYWEKILSESNLSVEREEPEPIEITTEEFNEIINVDFLPEEDYQKEDEPQAHYNGITKDVDTLNADRSCLYETNDELRTKVDGDEHFFTGHRIIRIKRGNRKCPDWAADIKLFRELLLKAFPKLNTDAKQRRSAGRWARIAQLYFRSQMTNGQIAHELGISIGNVKSIIRSITRTSKGERTNGSGARTRRKR